MRTRRHTQEGQAIVLLALMMAVLVGFVALSIDTARAFDSRRILQDSVDAAALTAAESYQAGAGWGTSQANAMAVFERDSRLYGGDNCPAGAFSTPAIGTPVNTVCTVGGGSGYTVQIFAADYAAAGQAFVVGAIRPLPVALMQVLSGTSSISIQATGGALANDQSQTPALGSLIADNTCPGGAGLNPAIHIENKTNFMTVYGDVVGNGSLSMGGLSYLHLAGNALTRCAAPINPDHITYECWPRGEATPPPCAADELPGTLYSTSNRLADPGYTAPVTTGTTQTPGNNVLLSPGIYTVDPNFSKCYFLQPGVYEWQGGLTVNGGLVSNELKPPSESGTQFWAAATCAGSFTLTAQAPGVRPPLATGTYAAVVTSVRPADNGVIRESAPSACQTVSVASNQVVQLAISNVPGAVSYNLYATATGGSCAGPFNLVSGTINAGGESNNTLGGCPNPTDSTNCSLGHVLAFYDGNSTSNATLHPPSAEAAPFAAGLPNQSPVRAIPPLGDLANENHCVSLGVSATCPVPGTRAASTTFVTPGAVVMKITQGSCFNVLGGDAFLFSGYQYNWLLNYEPPATTCNANNNWNGAHNSAAIGLSYTPGAPFNINGDSTCSGPPAGSCNTTGSFEGPMGGILAGSIHINFSSGLVIDFDAHYAPGPGGARLIV
jgi:Flp pilus assembly protein TadG